MPDRVGDLQRDSRIQPAQHIHQGAVGIVNLVLRKPLKLHRLQHALARFAAGAVERHPQREREAGRRNEDVALLLLAERAKDVEAEPVIGRNDLALGRRERARRLGRGIRPNRIAATCDHERNESCQTNKTSAHGAETMVIDVSRNHSPSTHARRRGSIDVSTHAPIDRIRTLAPSAIACAVGADPR